MVCTLSSHATLLMNNLLQGEAQHGIQAIYCLHCLCISYVFVHSGLPHYA